MTRPAVLDRPAPPSRPERQPLPVRWRVGRAMDGAGLALLTAVAFAPAFGRTPGEALTDPRYTGAVTGVVAATAAVCLLLAIGTQVAPVTRVVAALAVLAGYVTLVVEPGWAVVGGPKRLLTSALPLDPGGPELATVVIVVGLATIGAVEPALRRRAAALPLVAPLAATVLGSAMSAGGGAPVAWLAPAFAFGAAVLLAFARYAPADAVGRPAERTRQVVAGLLGCAMLAGVAAVGWYGPVLLTRTGRNVPADARNLVPQPVRPREGASPLVLFPALLGGDRTLSLTVRAKVPLRLLRYVSLDRFDGEHWNTSARYRRTGGRLPTGAPVRSPVRHLEEQVDITNPGPLAWLVSSGRPIEVSVSGLGVNEDTGDVVLPADRKIPADYTVLSALPMYDRRALAAAAPAAPAAPSRAADGLPLPKTLTSLATRIVRGESGYPALRRLADYFHSSNSADTPFRVDRTSRAPGGHGLHQIDRLLETGDGTAEQYASAFAVMARALGYDTRVVMGFRPRPKGPEVYTVTGKDVHAWVEVRFASLGWVPFDPTPTTSTTDVSRPLPPRPSPSPSRAVPNDRPGLGANRPNGQSRQSGTAPDRGRHGDGALVLAAIGGLLVLSLGVIPVAKSARTRRRRRLGDPDRRTLAAWRDTLDRLGEAGLRVTPADTSGEIVAATGLRFGDGVGLPVRRLALLHDEAAFAPDSLTEAAAEAAWLHADQVGQEIHTNLPPLHRLRAALSPRPLVTGR